MRAFYQPIKQAIHHSVHQSIKQSANQSIKQTTVFCSAWSPDAAVARVSVSTACEHITKHTCHECIAIPCCRPQLAPGISKASKWWRSLLAGCTTSPAHSGWIEPAGPGSSSPLVRNLLSSPQLRGLHKWRKKTGRRW